MEVKTPHFLIDESLIEKNLKILAHVKSKTGCKILLAQKAFSCYDFYPLISKFLDGTTASGLFEARLGKTKFGKETHVFAPAFTDSDIKKIIKNADHIVFNSKAQLLKHYEVCNKAGMQIGVRVNPECRTQDHEIYDPCAPLSRFGIKAEDFDDEVFSKIDGIHFHTLCEQGFDALEKTCAAFEKKFGKYLSIKDSHLKWINFGGGHHITRKDYDVNGLIKLINNFKKKYNLNVYLEPGEAVVLNSGFLTATVLDIVHNERNIAILDISAACHNPDILETGHDYMPEIIGATQLDSAQGFLYRLAGNTCLAGDYIGDYTFQKNLNIGEKITFTNMAHYTIVKTNMFNGINLPSIYVKRLNGEKELIKEFGYKNFTSRLGK